MRTQVQGRYLRRSDQSQNYDNKYNNYNPRQHSSTKRTPTTEAPAGNQRNTDFLPKRIADKKLLETDHIRKYLPYRIKSFQGGTLTFRLKQWKDLTSDQEILATVSGMHTKITDNLPAVKLY